jgi:hypothetical protein
MAGERAHVSRKIIPFSKIYKTYCKYSLTTQSLQINVVHILPILVGQFVSLVEGTEFHVYNRVLA